MAHGPAHEPLTDPLLEPGFWQSDPDAHYARLRREAPVAWNDTRGFWALARHEEVLEVSTSPERFASAQGILLMEIGVTYPSPPTMMHTDPPEHTAYRKMVAPAFRPSRIAAMEDGVRTRVRDLLATLPADQAVDIVPALSVPYPLRVISDLLGIPDDDWERFFYWSEAMVPGALELTADERAAAQAEMQGFFLDEIAARRGAPGADLISTLVQVEVDGQGLSTDELFMFLTQLLVAGNETTRNLITGGLVALAEHPEQWRRLQEDRALLDPAVEEMLRWTTPVISFMRTATVDTELGGRAVRAGDRVLMLYGSANRDERQFGPRAPEFDVGRDPNPHLAFGFGAHFCIGAALARLEARVLLEELLGRATRLQLAGPVERSPSDVIAGITSAPLRLDTKGGS